MAPVKRSATTAQRETRSTRSAAVAKKNATTVEKKAVSPLGKTASNSAIFAATTRGAKKATRAKALETEEDEVQSVIAEEPQAKKTTKTRTTKPTTTLAAAPRRRIKVTPLDDPKETVSEEAKPARVSSKDPVAVKKSNTRSRKAVEDEPAEVQEPLAPQVKTTRRAATKPKDGGDKKDAAPAVKPRGRPKKNTAADSTASSSGDVDAAPVARSTRSQRAGSVASQTSKLADPVAEPKPKSAANTRKKVTFQDLPEDDKENQPLPQTKVKRAVASKTSATGLKAKPVRKTAAAGVTKAKKATAPIRTKANVAAALAEAEKQTSRALTPKKITQVAKGTTVEDEQDNLSDEEDELNGGKTPVRDLSMSPRRPLNFAMAQAMSPSKKLNLDQSFAHTSPAKTLERGEAHNQPASAILASPARRLPASPFKDGLMDSPKRGMGDSTRLLFPSQSRSQNENGASITLNPANVTSASQSMATLLQSPKRSGALDSSFFSQSAMKKSANKSPFKSSLLASPAKRLFSPAKKSANSLTPKISECDIGDDVFDSASKSTTQEVVASSHFRASVSPIRVHRIETVGLDMDFDDSVLQVGSPLKIRKSPTKVSTTPRLLQSSELETASLPAPIEELSTVTPELRDFVVETQESTSIDPSQLERCPDEVSEQNVTENSAEDSIMHQTVDEVFQQPALPISLPSQDLREDDVSSEDELATEFTPVRSLLKNQASLTNPNLKLRQSLGVPLSAAGKGFGFTPLAAQMSGWLASSPQKTPKPRIGGKQRHGSFEFTPVARQHVDGEVVISRDATPVQKLNKRDSLALSSSTKNRVSLGNRKSLPNPENTADGSPSADAGNDPLVPNSEFEEYMDMRAAEEASQSPVDESAPETQTASILFADGLHPDEILEESAEETEGDTILVHDVADTDNIVPIQAIPELDASLINFTHASDTAMIDFENLAKEADTMASEASKVKQTAAVALQSGNVPVLAEVGNETSTSPDESFADENQNPEEDYIVELAPQAVIEQFPLPEKAPLADLQPSAAHADSPSMLFIDHSSSPVAFIEDAPESAGTENQPDLVVTPARTNIQLTKARIVNTVVSKVPLKPEGHVSPIKMQRKRARSFGNGDGLPQKRLSLGSLKQIGGPSVEVPHRTPDRRLRTSVAPSPGGTSTPASHYGRESLGGVSTFTTPGQTSFAVDDFGDSTLDGIEIPDDSIVENTFQEYGDGSSPAMSEKTYGLVSLMTTPKLGMATTPATAKRGARRVTAPALVPSTPATAKKTPVRHSMSADTQRTPLQPVGKGVLSGAIVYVDVHTSEGADASGIFVELLTQMGAKCVKDWRWNPRASMAAGKGEEAADSNVGITHVVYKDGGKRTLEKVRDTKGDVWCVGVAWVLDCERESKWLDEANYVVDTSLLPRGGSRRRKSMEPRALLLANDGSISASRPRRSVSAEMSELMKRELVNTPARGRDIVHDASNNNDADDDDDDDCENQEEAATPTGFISYDPRTAMTPGTPYLISQGKKLVQMSAPPKQTGKRLFEEEDDEENQDAFADEGARGLDGDKSVSDAKKFRMKNLDMKSRRRTLGFKPVVGSPLSRL